ncbi:MAG: hypothetical protein NTW65_10415 [Deltaproteobacteria bacterium]|nr:hypothetical protein [Deltaproteobacteria bacterium]
MSTPYLMCRRKYSSPEAGGGVPGKDAGTAPSTMTEAGVITEGYQVFTDIFILVGEMISGNIGGEGNRGDISGYLTGILIAIGVTGKETGTGTVVVLVTPVEDLICTVQAVPVEDPDLACTTVEDPDPVIMVVVDPDLVCTTAEDPDLVIPVVVDLDLGKNAVKDLLNTV